MKMKNQFIVVQSKKKVMKMKYPRVNKLQREYSRRIAKLRNKKLKIKQLQKQTLLISNSKSKTQSNFLS